MNIFKVRFSKAGLQYPKIAGSSLALHLIPKRLATAGLRIFISSNTSAGWTFTESFNFLSHVISLIIFLVLGMSSRFQSTQPLPKRSGILVICQSISNANRKYSSSKRSSRPKCCQYYTFIGSTSS